jgi:hypothetical protein
MPPSIICLRWSSGVVNLILASYSACYVTGTPVDDTHPQQALAHTCGGFTRTGCHAQVSSTWPTFLPIRHGKRAVGIQLQVCQGFGILQHVAVTVQPLQLWRRLWRLLPRNNGAVHDVQRD